MSDEKQETIEDIVAEMRDATMNGEYDDATVDAWADRIEAAAKRERESGAEAAQICGEIGEAIGRGSSGNAAKMREALSDASYAMHNFLKTQYGGYEEMAKALDKAKAALSAPPRNCDVYTVGEALRKYGFPTKIKPWGEKEWLDFCEWLVSEVEGETKGE